MSKYLMYVATLVLSVTLAACAAQYRSQRGTGGDAYAAEALQHGQAAYDRQDYLTAFREWLPLAQQGYAIAQYNLGLLYAQGRGVAQDDALAARWYGQAAAQGYAPAQTSLGSMYAQGRGVAHDDTEAVRWYWQAAQQGHAMAQTSLGYMYDHGRGVVQDYAKALHWLKQAAVQGYAMAQYNLGVMYAHGRGVARDDAEAVRWYRLAAWYGDAHAHHSLGYMYAEGRGVTRDLVEAQRWYAKAADLFPPGSNERMAAIEARDQVARQLTANQVPVSEPTSVTPPTPISVSPPPNADARVVTEQARRVTEQARRVTEQIERKYGKDAPPTPLSASPPPPAPRPALSRAEEIPIVKVGGVYELPVEINGVLTLKFVLDSGAAEVNLPADVVLTLVRTETIKKTDFLPGETYTLANGLPVNSARFLLRSLKIGTRRVTNVAASIGPVSSPLLLGQSFLEKLGAWGIDNQKQVLVLHPSASQTSSASPPSPPREAVIPPARALSPRAESTGADQFYRRALKEYQERNFEAAVLNFKQFLRQAPRGHPQAGNAQYLIGEALYAQRQYEAAIVALDEFVQKHSDDPKVPAAILKQGYAFAELRDARNARVFLQQVQNKYPGSFEAYQAAEKLRQIR